MNQQTTQQLTKQFGTEEILVFSENEHGLIRANVTTPTCTAEIYMQGAHLTRWQPNGEKPVLFLSERSGFHPGKAIRGGVPLIFPWFGARKNIPAGTQPDAPSHGFARTSNQWLLVSVGRSKDDFMMTFELTENEDSTALGFRHFKVTYKVSVGDELELELIVENQANDSMQIEEAFHTYFAVSDAEQITLSGLSDTEYLDKTDNFQAKKQTEKVLRLTGETDRPYLYTESKIDIEDQAWQRKISVDKLNSQSTVVWNPWTEQTAKLSDMDPDGWKQMVCVETANVDKNAITLPPGGHHAMHARIRVTPL